MSKFESAFRDAVANAERDVLLAQIRSNPQMTLSELGRLTTGDLGKLVRTLTIGDLIEAYAGGTPRASESRRTSKKRERTSKKRGPASKKREPASKRTPTSKRTSSKPSAVQTRTPAGRERYDKAIFAALQGADKPLSSEELRAQVGGTPLQARASLARLINAERVTWEGKARGTRYSAVAD